MLSQELKQEVLKLPPNDRLALVSAIIESLQEQQTATPERTRAIQRMRGLLKTDQPAPTDEEDDFSDEDLAESESEWRNYVRGDDPGKSLDVLLNY